MYDISSRGEIRFETRHIEIEAQLGLYGEREAAAQAMLVALREPDGLERPAWFTRASGQRRHLRRRRLDFVRRHATLNA